MQADLGVVVSVCAFRIVIYLLTVGYSHVLMNGFGIYDGKRYGFQGNVHKLMRINRQLILCEINMNYRKNVKIGHEFEMFGYGFIWYTWLWSAPV